MSAKKYKCGIIMPISSIEDCSSEHWAEVLEIIKEALKDSEFDVNLVSDADDIGIIHKRIVQYIYNSEIVICDISCRNPNVMFELGLRLAFDKPTLIIKDDKTEYSFDTSIIEHLGYRRDLRFASIQKFKNELKVKLEATFKKSIEDPNYTTFLKNFGNYKVAKLDKIEISPSEYIVETLKQLQENVFDLKMQSQNRINSKSHKNMILNSMSLDRLNQIEEVITKHYKEYLKENPIRRMKDLLIVKDEIYEYLESQEEVRKVCGHGSIIEFGMEKVIYN